MAPRHPAPHGAEKPCDEAENANSDSHNNAERHGRAKLITSIHESRPQLTQRAILSKKLHACQEK